MKMLLDHGADPDYGGRQRGPPLISATILQKLDMIYLLCEYGADVNKRYYNKTPLSSAADRGHLELVRYLCANGANVNQDALGWTPLMRSPDRLDIVQELCANGAEVNNCGDGRSTPLNEATSFGNLDVVRELLSLGADVNMADKAGKTPLMCAALDGDKVIIELFFPRGADIHRVDDNGWSALDFALDDVRKDQSTILSMGLKLLAERTEKHIESFKCLVEQAFVEVSPVRTSLRPLVLILKTMAGMVEAMEGMVGTAGTRAKDNLPVYFDKWKDTYCEEEEASCGNEHTGTFNFPEQICRKIVFSFLNARFSLFNSSFSDFK